jgi:glyoxylase-like metal-dependent hydrolase (beta-lactamase superfamily II)
MTAPAIDFRTTAPCPGDLDVRWIHGVPAGSGATEAPIQVHAYDEHTYILRQSKSVHVEAPFVFLLLGNERALLLDTGATADPERFPLRRTVDGLVDAWLAEHPREDYELLVAHTHGHGDHVAADPQFADRPRTTVVPRDADAVRAFFGFGEAWPEEERTLDLGGRELRLIPAPGHHAASVVFHDPWTGLLLTGDTVLPGRLYAPDFPAYLASLNRLTAFAETHPVTHVLGCHVEMTTTPGRDFPIGARYQPGEVAPQFTVAQLTAVRDACAAVADRPGVHVFDDFIVYNGMGLGSQLRLQARGLLHRLPGLRAR